MPRIAGRLGRGSAAELLEAQRAGAVAPGQEARLLDLDGASLGWLGRGEALVASEGPLSAVLDGRIFNREELGKAKSDAALLLALCGRHGFAGALKRINGDLACALWDGKARTLWLGRDRFGIRPLYWAKTRDGLAFGSRPRALFSIVSPVPRREYLALFAGSHYRTFDNDPERSPYEGIDQLPAASWLKCQGGRIQTGRYWELRDEGDLAASETKLAGRYRELLLDSVRLRQGSAARGAFTLSGGMDSSSVLACAARNSGRKQHAFSTVYEDATYDETSEIKTMLAETVKEWHPVRLGTPDVPSLVQKMVLAHDEPVATATWLSHYALCGEVARAGFAQLFGGLGGDELNAGEYEYFFFFFADLAAGKDEETLLRETALWAKHHDHPIFKKNESVMREGLSRLADLSRPGACRTDRKRLERYAKALKPGFFDLEGYEPILDRVFSSYLKNRTFHDLFRETLPCCIRAQDRHGEAFGIEHYLPFLDHRLVELMFRVPAGLKIREGVTKHLLRRAMEGILPEETRTRIKKTGWNAPAHVWFSGPGRQLVLDLARSRSFRERGVYDPAEVERLAEEHDEIVRSGAARDNHMMFFWQLVNLELWLRSLKRVPV